jgi:tRNA threonylcarbamoyladenosine biosynthesis protein TsaB
MKTKEKLAGRRLFINSAADQSRIVFFDNNEKVAEEIIESRSELSDKLLSSIDKLSKANNFQIEEVSVFPGPGSYTGLRIGVTTANFLAWSFQLPIYEASAEGKIMCRKKNYVLPIYLSKPHITKPNLR